MTDQSVRLEMARPTPKKRRPFRWAAILVFLLLMAGCGLWLWTFLGAVSTERAVVDGRIYTVSPRISAPIAEVLAKQGQTVAAGQPLVRLDSSVYRQHTAESRSLVAGTRPAPTMAETAERAAQAQALEEQVVQRVARARYEEAQARQQLEQKVTAHVKAQLEMRGIDARGGSSSSTYARAQKNEAQARAQMEGARAALEESSRVRAAVEGEINRVRQEVAEARQAGVPSRSVGVMDSAMLAEGDPTLLTAPVAGRIVQQQAVAGAQAQRGQPLVGMVPANVKDLWIIGYFSAKEAAQLRPGQPCDIRLEAAPGAVIPGVVDAVLPPEQPQEQAANTVVSNVRVPVRVLIPAYDPATMPALAWGMATSFTVRTHTVPWLERWRSKLSFL